MSKVMQSNRPPAVSDIHILWMTAGLGCDGDTVSITDLEAVRALTGRLGSANVKRLVDIVG